MDEVEISILNAATKHKRLAIDLAFSVTDDYFNNPNVKIIAGILFDYIHKFKETPTRRVCLNEYSDNPTIQSYLNNFFDTVELEEYDPSDYKYDLSRLVESYKKKRLSVVQNTMDGNDLNDVEGVVQDIQRELNHIKSANLDKAYERKEIKNYVDSFKNNFIEKIKNPDVGKGILTGYSFFDYIKNGLRPADLIIIAGETGSGKSMFMNNMAVQCYMQSNTVDTPVSEFVPGCNVVYFSLEMPYDDCFRRTVARMADVPEYGIRDAKLSKAEAAGLSKACNFMKDYPYSFDIVDVPRGFTVEQLDVMFEEIKGDYIPDVIFLDYLGLMEDADEGGDDWLTLGKLAGKVHEFARAHEIPVVTAVQLNRIDPQKRKSESSNIGLHRIGRSSLIATHATAIIQIESREDEQTYDDFIYHIIKNRHGQSGKSHSIVKNFSRCSIIDRPYTSENENSFAFAEDLSYDMSDIISILTP
jgi:replicative DNA helicase